MNLNDHQPRIGDHEFAFDFGDNSERFASVDCEIVFRNHEAKILSLIKENNCILGCVAWLTNLKILDALSLIPYVSIVVQKEDFLRPDLGSTGDWKKTLRQKYSMLKNESERHGWPGLLGQLSIATDPSIDPIRCVGNHNKDKRTHPRMHNKFLIFGNARKSSSRSSYGLDIDFDAVWTGSYNVTFNATQSLENAVILRDTRIAQKYYSEYCQIFSISEPLNWECEWVAPEYWIGT